jgi:hypothetical protein
VSAAVPAGVWIKPASFISYAHSERKFVDALSTKLDRLGVRYWRDTQHATAGRLDEVIERGLTQNPTVLLVLSKH